nr:ATP-binding protein [uncultured Caldimonas sp.]
MSAYWKPLLSELKQPLGWFAVLLAGFLSALGAHGWVLDKGHRQLSAAAMRRVDLYYAGLESELGKYEYLPSILDLHEDVLALLQTADKGTVDAVNRKLEVINQRAQSSAIHVLSTQGLVLASSEWAAPDSVVGRNLSFNPTFQDALHKGQGRFYAAGTSHGSPTYYYAREIGVGGNTLGVGVVEADLERIERNWWPGSERTLVFDQNGVVILSSTREWKHKAIHRLAAHLQVRSEAVGQYASPELPLLGLAELESLEDGGSLVRLPTPTGEGMEEVTFLARTLTLARTGWSVMILADTSGIRENARYAGLGAGLAAALVGVSLMLRRARREVMRQESASQKALAQAYEELERRVEERTSDLQHANDELRHEISERRRAEQVLLETQNELVQAGKLATLGQMAAGVTHELNQPLHALRTHCSNALQLLQRQHFDGVIRNVNAAIGLADRMARITLQLKTFARKSPARYESVVLGRAVGNVTALLGNRLRDEGVEVHVDIPESLRVMCDGSRLEQVLVNLFANAMDAMRGAPDARITVVARAQKGRVVVQVRDNGPGFPETVLQRLFEPFFTTKPSGEGLGLGLVISSDIVRAFGSQLRARNAETGGALFEFDLEHDGSDADVREHETAVH